MKILRLSILLSMLYFLSSLFGENRQYVERGQSYKNDTGETVYLVVELPPDKTFKNNSQFPLQIVRKQDFAQFDYHIQLQNKVNSLESSLKSTTGRLDELQQKYEQLKNQGESK